MNSLNKTDLENIVNNNDYQNNTSVLRQQRNSDKIQDDLNTLIKLKSTHANMREIEPDKFENLCRSQCYYLFTKYPFIYKKAFNDQLNPILITKLLQTLKKIENNELDQHQGSVVVGQILKEMYVDSVISDDEHSDSADTIKFVEPIHVSWKEFKNNN